MTSLVSAVDQYVGVVPYVYGGSTPKGWDCSGMFYYVLPHNCGIQPPGRVVMSYVTWRGAKTVRNPQPGDLVLWPGIGPMGHMGVVTGDNEMISALNPSEGTARTPIAGYGPVGVPHIYRRITALAGDTSGSGTSATDTSVEGVVGGAFLKSALQMFHLPSLGDGLERAGLIVLGVALIIVALFKMTGSKTNVVDIATKAAK